MKKIAYFVIAIILSGCKNHPALDKLTKNVNTPKEEKIAPLSFHGFLAQQTGLTVIRSDEDVQGLSRWVTTTLLDTYNNRSKFPNEIFPPYFKENIESSDASMPTAFCQRSALSLAESLAAYGIKTRQINAEEGGNGIHQFLEYQLPQENKWKIIDPFLGIQYKVNGSYIHHYDLEKMEDNEVIASISAYGKLTIGVGDFEKYVARISNDILKNGLSMP